MIDTFGKGVGTLIGTMLVVTGFIILITYPTMWLWNWLMSTTFGLPELTFWQTFGLMILTRLILPTISNSTKSN
jgi:hypothetical protein